MFRNCSANLILATSNLISIAALLPIVLNSERSLSFRLASLSVMMTNISLLLYNSYRVFTDGATRDFRQGLEQFEAEILRAINEEDRARQNNAGRNREIQTMFTMFAISQIRRRELEEQFPAPTFAPAA